MNYFEYLERIIYFLSNFFLLNVSFIFILPLFFKTKEEYDKIKSYIFGNSVHVYAGFFGVVLFIGKMIFTSNKLIILDDLLPSIVILVLSIMLLFGYIRISKFIKGEMIKKGDEILTSLQVPVGFIGIFTGIVHVFLYKIIFL